MNGLLIPAFPAIVRPSPEMKLGIVIVTLSKVKPMSGFTPSAAIVM